MNERFPGYDVLNKRAGLSWNHATRAAVDARLAVSREPRFFDAPGFAVLERLLSLIHISEPTRPY